MFEKSFEIGRTCVMEGSRWILVKVVLFQLRGCGHPQGDAMPNFFPDSKSTIIGLSNEASFVSRYYCKISENWEKEESIIQLYVSKRGTLYNRRGRTFFNLVPTRKLGADNTRILAKFSFELILLYVFAPELGADQSVCRYMFSRACVIKKFQVTLIEIQRFVCQLNWSVFESYLL